MHNMHASSISEFNGVTWVRAQWPMAEWQSLNINARTRNDSKMHENPHSPYTQKHISYKYAVKID